MMKYIFSLMLLCAVTAYAQDPNAKRCEFITDGSAEWQNLKVKFAHLCDWQAQKDKDGTKSFGIDKGDCGLVETISISKPKNPITPESMDKMISADNYKNIEKNGGKFLWGRKLKIDNQDCAEYAIQIKKKILFQDVLVYMVYYTFSYKEQAVTLMFVTTGQKEQIVTQQFNANKPLFLSLAMATHFIQ